MSIAVFKPFILAAQEGERVWEKLVQKVIEKDEVDEHVADGWHTDAATALEAANTAEVEQGNAALQAQIDATKATLAKRTAKKAEPMPEPLRTDGPTVAEFVAAGYQATNYPPQGYEPRSTVDEIAAAVKAQAEAAPPAA